MPSFTKLPAQTKAFYLRTLNSLKHPEAFSIHDLIEVMLNSKNRPTGNCRAGSRRLLIPTKTELALHLHSIPGIKRIGTKRAAHGHVRFYRYTGGLKHDH